MTHPSDKELDDYLRRDSQVSQSYRMLDADEVPSAIDASVMAQARAAVSTPTKSKPRASAWMRWSSPLALAASAVLVVAIVLEVGVQDELRLPAPQFETSVSANKADAPAASADSTEARVAQDMVNRPLESIAPAAPAVVPLPPPPQPERYASVPSSGLSPFASEPPAQSAPKLEEPRKTASAAPATPQPSAFSVTSARADAAAAAAAEARQRREAEEVIVTGNRVRATPEDAAMPVEVLKVEEVLLSESRSVESRDEPQSNDRTRPSFGPRAPGAPRPAQAASKESADAASGQTAVYSTPESWLEAIRKLRADGKSAEADEQWRLFRRDYPNYPMRAGDTAIPASQR